MHQKVLNLRAQKYTGLQDKIKSWKVGKGFIDQEQHLKTIQAKPRWLRTWVI